MPVSVAGGHGTLSAVTQTLIGVALLVVGLAVLFLLGRPRPDVPPAGWFPDPSTLDPRQRFWDGRVWTAWVAPAWYPARRGGWFQGRFWGPWVAVLGVGVAVVSVGGSLYASSGRGIVQVVAGGLGMALVCLAFAWFVDRQIGLREVAHVGQLAAATVAGCGAALLAATANQAVLHSFGWSGALAAVGVVEELAKYLVPIVLYRLHRYRDPRAGIVVALGSGFGFAILETVSYSLLGVSGNLPSVCGSRPVTIPPAANVVLQTLRIFTTEPVHWLWTATAVAVGWRLWHLYGRRGTIAALGTLAAVIVAHSANDLSSLASCAGVAATLGLLVAHGGLLVLSYLAFKAALRATTPPTLVGLVSWGWTPTRLPRPRPTVMPDRPSDMGQGALED